MKDNSSCYQLAIQRWNAGRPVELIENNREPLQLLTRDNRLFELGDSKQNVQSTLEQAQFVLLYDRRSAANTKLIVGLDCGTEPKGQRHFGSVFSGLSGEATRINTLLLQVLF